MTSIAALLARRSDLSTFLVHLTRSTGNQSAKDRLLSIIESRAIEARTVYGQAAQALSASRDTDSSSQKVVCFTEVPLEHINLLTEEIDGRDLTFAPYGIAVTKQIARRRGVNPVWYIDITPRHDWLTVPLNNLIDAAIASGTFPTSDIARIAPFIEQMGTRAGFYRKEFWWEREWRIVGNFQLADRYIGISPAADIPDLKRATTEAGLNFVWIDAGWSLEQIIGHLAGFDSADIGVGA